MTDLDDFFAKKDKNRKKKTKGISNEDFVQKYEQNCVESINLEKKSVEILNNLQGFIQDDGEWNDFEDDRKDYSGLKIQSLAINDENQEENDEELNEEAEDKVWGKKETEDPVEEEPKQENSQEETPENDDDEKTDTSDKTSDDSKTDKIAAMFKELAMSKRIGSGGGTIPTKLETAPVPKLDDSEEFPDLGAAPVNKPAPAPVNKPVPAPVNKPAPAAPTQAPKLSLSALSELINKNR